MRRVDVSFPTVTVFFQRASCPDDADVAAAMREGAGADTGV